MFKAVVIAVLFASQTLFAFDEAYPTSPDRQLTPGELCNSPDSYRYPEKIAYCERDVDTGVKKEIIKTYDQVLHYQVESIPRNKIKIDHYIPLCMGGSNDQRNLWPQHETVYKVTDPVEETLCEKMAEGKLRQADAVDLIRRAKNNLTEAREILEKANSL